METYDVFISYRRSGGRDKARLLYKELESRGIKCFFDFNSLRSGLFDENIYKAIESCRYFVLMVTDGAFDRCVHPDDWVRMEVEYALKHSKEIVPIAPSDQLQCFPDGLPESLAVLKNRQISELNMGRLFEKSVDLIIEDRFSKEYVASLASAKEDNADGLPVLGKAVDEVTLTGLTGEDVEHFKKALGYYRVLRRRSALKELQAIGKKDDPIVKYYVARFSYELDGTVSDADLEESCCAARELGCADAMVAFAEMHLLNDDKAFDTALPVECIEGLKKAIEKGNADALMQLSLAYERGKGLVKDVSMARQLLKKASDSGSLRGKFAYGLDLITGECGEKDEGNAMTILTPLVEHLQHHEEELTVAEHALLALFYLTQSADDMDSVWKHFKFVEESRGHSLSDNKVTLEFAYYFMGLKLLSDTTNTDNAKLAVEYFHKAISIGVNGLGELGLAECYDNGYGLEQDDKKSLELYQKAASKGNGDAQTILVGKFLEDDENQGIEKGRNWLKLAAEDGSAMAEHLYGLCLIAGKYFPEDIAAGMKWLEKAAEQGYADAMNDLGKQYYGGNDAVEANQEKAFEWFKRGAEAGSADAMESLGLAYLYGIGTVPDTEAAKKWLSNAADKGIASAKCALGTRYFEGDFGEKDVSKAIEWWEKAAKHEDGGDSTAMLNLGKTYRDGDDGVEKNLDKAVEWLTKASDAGNEDAACELGAGYYRGDFGKPDMTMALKWMQKAAKLGDATAMNIVGMMYRDGDVGKVDLGKSIDWFKRAANCEIPNADAMCNLGEAYLEGKGVEKDVKEAEKWYRKAADTGESDAEAVLGTKYYNGDFGEPNYTKAKKWWERAGEHGDSAAMFNLATSYRDGDFGEKDIKQWIYWVERSIAKGNVKAMEEYAMYLFENGDEAQCKKLLTRASDAGNASAMNSLALRLYNGDFGVKDVKGAVQLWERAAELKFGKAMCNLGELYLAGDDDISPDADIALSWYKRAADEGEGFGCCRMGQHYLSIMAKRIDSYDEFAKCVSASFGDESSKIRAIRKAKGMFAKAIESNDPGAVAYGHLTLARIAKLQGDEETSNEHYATAAEYGLEEHAPQSIFARMLDSVPFLKRKRT